MVAPALALRNLLDTCILIHYIRGGELGEWIEANYKLMAVTQIPIISVVTVGEIRSFAIQRSWGEKKIDDLQNLANRFVHVPLDFPGIYQAYAEIDAYSRRVGHKMGKNDAWIAATARVTGTRLLTTDNDFDHLHPDWIQRDWINPMSHL